jgi:hypothetical protein
MAGHHHHRPGATGGEYPVLNLNPGVKWSKGLTSGRLDTFGELLLFKKTSRRSGLTWHQLVDISRTSI